MATDDLMILFASCGLASTLIYLAGELIHWAAIKAANRRALIQARILYKRLHTVTKRATARRERI